MKKIFLFVAIFLLTLISIPVSAAYCPNSGDPSATGLVPCGVSCQCTLANLFVMLGRIYNFIVTIIAVPLATLVIIAGAIMIMISGGSPEMAGRSKKALMAGIIGLVLVFCSWVIINTVMSILGYSLGSWYQLSI